MTLFPSRRSRAPQGVRSVDRAVTVLKILARRGSAGVSEHELVRQSEERGHYELGFDVLRFANSIPGRLDLVPQARPVMDALALELDETINIAMLRQGVVVNVGQSVGRSAVAYHNWIGELTPPHATSSGKVLLANLSADQWRTMTKHLDLFTDQTITTRAALDEELWAVSQDGYASTHEELEVGLRAVSAPIRDHSGATVAALTASGRRYRVTDKRTPVVVTAVRGAAEEVNTRLGYFGAAAGA